MDAQEIPLLTEVYKTKSSTATTNDDSHGLTAEDVVEIVDDYKAGMEAEVTAEVLKTLKPQLTAEITEALTQHLTHTLTEKITQQLSGQSLSGEWLSNIRQEIVEALKPTNHTMAALQNAFTNQAEIDPDVILQAVEQKNNVFLVEAQQALEVSHQRLIQENAERMNLDIASKITGMQELAVTQAKSQIMQQMAEAEEAFSLNVHAQAAASQQKTVDAIRASQEAYADSLASYAADMQAQANERLKTYFDAQVTAFSQDVLSEHKQAFTNEMSAFYQTQTAESNQAHQAELAELTNVYQAQIKQAKDGFNQQAQAVSGELLQVVTAYAQKLNEEADAKLASVQQSLQAQVAGYARTLNEEADAKLASVQSTLQAQVADYATQLNDETTAKLLAVQETVQASMTSYAQQVADETHDANDRAAASCEQIIGVEPSPGAIVIARSSGNSAAIQGKVTTYVGSWRTNT